jgi:hypothetical protein
MWTWVFSSISEIACGIIVSASFDPSKGIKILFNIGSKPVTSRILFGGRIFKTMKPGLTAEIAKYK